MFHTSLTSTPKRLVLGSEVTVLNGAGPVKARVVSLPSASHCTVVDGDGVTYRLDLQGGAPTCELHPEIDALLGGFC